MCDSELLGIIARTPVKKRTELAKVRPLSPKALVRAPDPDYTFAEQPESPRPVFNDRADYYSAIQDDPVLEDSASIVAERIARYQQDDTNSILLEVMRNEALSDLDEGIADTTPFHSVGQPSTGGNIPNVPNVPNMNDFQPFQVPKPVNQTAYKFRDYSDNNFGRVVPGLPFESMSTPVLDRNGVRYEQPSKFAVPPVEPTLCESRPPDLSDAKDYNTNAYDVGEKEKLVSELFLKRSKGYDVPNYIGIHTSFEELHSLVENIRRQENYKRTVSLLRYFMIIGCTGIEKATMQFLSDVYLDGWAESIAANQNDYDEVLGRVAETMDISSNIPPQVELLTMLGVSGVMFHMAQKNKPIVQQSVNVPVEVPRIQKTQSPLTEEQVRIHNLITGQTQPTRTLSHFDIDRHSALSFQSDSAKPRKKAKITIDTDEIVRLF
jgi:Family of unknown function (DUF5767)